MTDIDLWEMYHGSDTAMYDFIISHPEIKWVVCIVGSHAIFDVSQEGVLCVPNRHRNLPHIIMSAVVLDDDYSYIGDREGFIEHIHGIPDGDSYYRSFLNDADRVRLTGELLYIEYNLDFHCGDDEPETYYIESPDDWPDYYTDAKIQCIAYYDENDDPVEVRTKVIL